MSLKLLYNINALHNIRINEEGRQNRMYYFSCILVHTDENKMTATLLTASFKASGRN